jgi:hypothetical protein
VTQTRILTIAGTAYELYPARDRDWIAETLYRVNAGYGVGNPCFSLHLTPVPHQAMVLGQYLAKPRNGVKRAEAEALTAAARAELAGA